MNETEDYPEELFVGDEGPSLQDQLDALQMVFDAVGYASNHGFKAPGLKDALRELADQMASLKAYMHDDEEGDDADEGA